MQLGWGLQLYVGREPVIDLLRLADDISRYAATYDMCKSFLEVLRFSSLFIVYS